MWNLDELPPRGTVYGTLLNYRSTLDALGDQVHAAPYKAAPQAPILYIKPRNTLVGHGDPIRVPVDAPELEMGATLGVVIGRTACRVSADHAMDHVAGYTIMNDVSVPHASFYRPSMRFKCRDSFCPIGPVIVPRQTVANPDALNISVAVDGVVLQTCTTADLIRSVGQLIADITEFMTLHPGDVLSVGVAAGSPRARVGQRACITIDGIGQLDNILIAEETP